eukprot:252150-Prymnesium_polylepis.1
MHVTCDFLLADQQMMTGMGYMVRFTPTSAECIDADTCRYPPPLVPPIELEILYDKVPLDHSWGPGAEHASSTAPRAEEMSRRKSVTLPPQKPLQANCAPFTPTSTMVRIGAFEGAWKWHGGVATNDGRVYCIPCSGTSVLVIDVARRTAETFGNVGGSQAYKWNRACVGLDGKIYAMPSHHPSVLVVDPVSQQTSLLGHHDSRGSKWNHAVCSPHDGHVYGLPFDASQLLVIDPVLGATRLIGDFGPGKYKWRVGLLAPDGRIIGIPYNHEAVLVIDPAAGGATRLLPLPSSLARAPAKWNG